MSDGPGTGPPPSPAPLPLSTDAFQAERGRLARLLVELAVERRTVTLSSGRTSDFYVDTKQAILTAEGHYLVGRLFHTLVEQLAPQAVAVGGLTMGADPLASATSLVSWLAGRPRAAFYVRKEPKGHGTGAWLEGHKALRPGAPVVIVEDVITTGASTLRAIERVRAAGFEVVQVLAVVDREEDDGAAAVRCEAPLASLFGRRELVS